MVVLCLGIMNFTDIWHFVAILYYPCQGGYIFTLVKQKVLNRFALGRRRDGAGARKESISIWCISSFLKHFYIVLFGLGGVYALRASVVYTVTTQLYAEHALC